MMKKDLMDWIELEKRCCDMACMKVDNRGKGKKSVAPKEKIYQGKKYRNNKK